MKNKFLIKIKNNQSIFRTIGIYSLIHMIKMKNNLNKNDN